MGVSSIPPSTGGGANLPALAGSVVVSGVKENGFYSTALSAGKYAIRVGGAQKYVFDFYAVNTRRASANLVQANSVPMGATYYLDLNTSDTITISASLDSYILTQFQQANAITAVASPGVLGDGTVVFLGRDATNWYATTATDGITWASTAAPTVATTAVIGTNLRGGKWLNNAVFWGGDLASASASVLLRSTNGITWSTSNPATLLGTIVGLSHGGTGTANYLAVSENTATLNRNVASSTDGITWSIRTAGITAQITACASSSTAHVIVTNAGTTSTNIYSSTDSITWAARTSPTASASYNIAFGNGRFVATTDNGDVIYSTDGTTWSFGVQAKPSVLSGNNNYTVTASDNNNATFLFADGYFWTKTTHQWNSSMNSLAFSTDGITWERSYLNTVPAGSTSTWNPGAQASPGFLNYSTVYGTIFGSTSVFQSTTGRATLVVPKPIYVEIYNVSGTTL